MPLLYLTSRLLFLFDMCQCQISARLADAVGGVALDDPCFDDVGKNAAEKTHRARTVPAPPRTMAFPRSFLVLTETRVFLAMISLRTLLMSVFARSLSRLANGLACVTGTLTYFD